MIKRSALFFLFLASTSYSFSQDDDFGIWTALNFRYGIIKNLSTEVSGSIRTFNNTSQVEQSFWELGLQYKISKTFSAAASYRIISMLEDDSRYHPRHKLFLDFKTTLPSGNFEFTGRVRLQRTTKTYIEDTEDEIARYYGRLKLQAKYNLPSSPVKPFLYFEPFVPFNSGSGFRLSKYRLSAGIELRITRHLSVEPGYVFQRDYMPHISNQHVLSADINLKF